MSTERQYLDDEQARHLYHNDLTFRQLVDCMVMLIRQLRLTPGEVRSAATFAAVVHESRYPKPLYLAHDDFDETAGPEWFKAVQQTGHNLRVPTPPKSSLPYREGTSEKGVGIKVEDRSSSPDPEFVARLAAGERCHADRDGDCNDPRCPQTRDSEPEKSGRHCPLDRWTGADDV